MRINKNLIKDTKFKNPLLWLSADNYKVQNNIASIFVKPNLGLGIRFKLERNLEYNTNYKFSALVKSDKNIFFNYNYFMGKNGNISLYEVSDSFAINEWKKIIINFNFKYEKILDEIMVGCLFKDINAVVQIKQPKLEINDVTPYIPNKSDFELSKQQLVPPEGDYKEIQPM